MLEIDSDVRAPTHVQYGKRTTDVPLDEGLKSIDALHGEFLDYADILLGRVEAPIDSPYLQLMELASAYYARACEVEMLILYEEQQRRVIRGHPLYKFRTGQLRSFLEMSKKLADLGSRRLTQESLLSEMRYDAGEGR